MKHLLKNLSAAKGRFRLRADVGEEDGLTGAPKQGTGGLKLMTVFIAVLGLHVLVIGGITIYHFIKGPAKDASQTEASAPEATSPDGATDKAATADAASPADGTTASAPAAPAADGTADTASAGTPSVQTNDGATPAPTTAQAQAAMPAPALKTPAVLPAPVPPAPAPLAAAPVPAMSGGAPYVVKSGDTLHKIAAAHGMTVAKLKEANGLKSDMLHIGQKLVVGAAPAASAIAAAAPAAPSVAQAAPAPAVAAAPVAAPAPMAAAVSHSYTVVKGDTLTKIAKSFGTSPAAIMAANKLSDPKKLKIGQALQIPGRADRREISEQKTVPSTLQPQANPDLVMNK